MSPVSIILLSLLSLNVASSFTIDARARETSRWGQDDDDFISYNKKKDTLRLRWSIIYPGTKWCGTGDRARTYYDLGRQRQTDRCCRAHDYCADIIPAGETLHGLTNDDFYPRLSCECDEEFRRCLRATNRNSAEVVGWIYFDLLETQCFGKNWFGYKWYDVKSYYD